MLGRWEGGKLVAGHRVRLAGVAREAGLAVAVFSTPLCPQVLVRDRSQHRAVHRVSLQPVQVHRPQHLHLPPQPGPPGAQQGRGTTLHSVLGSFTLSTQVRASNTETAGEGLFAKKGFSTGDLVCPPLFTVCNCSLLWRCPY